MGEKGKSGGMAEIVKKTATILTGLAMLQSLRLTITGGAYAVSRFKIHPGETGLFIKMTLNTTEIFCVLGIFITTLYSVIRGRVKGGQGKTDYRKYDKYISIIITWLNFISFVVIFFAYHSGGERGHLSFYYWSLVAASLLYGMHQSMVLNMITKDVAYYFVGIPLSGLLILVYHVVFRYFYKKFNKQNIEFYLVIFQIEIAMGLWLLASIFWTWAFIDYDPPNPSERSNMDSADSAEQGNGRLLPKEELSFMQRIRQALSPFLMNIMGMAFIFFFYPAIAPYELVDSEMGYKIDLFVLFISIIAASIIVLAVNFGVGPNKKWTGKDSYFNYTWFLFIPFYGSMIIFFILLHYPYSKFSHYIRSRPGLIAILTVTLKSLDDIIRGISTNGVSMQGDVEDGDMASLANCLAQILLNIFSFLGLGYIKAFRMYDKDRSTWPTKGLGFLSCIWFWFKKSCSGGWESFLQSFTLNVRAYFEIEDADSIWSL